MVSDEAFAYLLVENYWDEWSTKNLDDYMGERCYNSSISKMEKRRATWGKYTKEAWGDGIMLDGIRMEYFDLISYVSK